MSFIVQPQTFFAIGPLRSFGATNQIFSGYVTITESTSDVVEITKQPVQQGASISDHAFKKPVALSIQIRFSSSLTQSLAKIYQNLLALQNSLTPFTCTTPKRTYQNMMFTALGVTTDKKTENVLAVNCSFEEIITVPITIANVPRSKLKNPGSNGGNQQVGPKNSILYNGAQAIGIRP